MYMCVEYTCLQSLSHTVHVQYNVHVVYLLYADFVDPFLHQLI